MIMKAERVRRYLFRLFYRHEQATDKIGKRRGYLENIRVQRWRHARTGKYNLNVLGKKVTIVFDADIPVKWNQHQVPICLPDEVDCQSGLRDLNRILCWDSLRAARIRKMMFRTRR